MNKEFNDAFSRINNYLIREGYIGKDVRADLELIKSYPSKLAEKLIADIPDRFVANIDSEPMPITLEEIKQQLRSKWLER